MYSLTKKFCQYQSLSLVSHSTNIIDNNLFNFNIEQLEQSIKIDVESHILLSLLLYAKELNEFIYNDERFSKNYFLKIENNLSNIQSNKLINELIQLIKSYFDKYLLSSIIIRCYIQIHVPSSQTGNNQGVNIQNQIIKELEDMKIMIETNENIFIDYYKKHYEILKYLNKYPSIEDYHLYLIEYEKKNFYDLRSIILELRTIFLKTYDIIIKNLTKIQMPRNQQNISMIN
ncbi:unnamed protein product [Rotaria sordida]|uniref:Proteasome activator PA28 C-terminal domain-containing protein n=1 Tax=Rotaria sordida TaxID=392033 RepID=A0A818QA21_9BILA|nr:unnamed protein product [Rotaria sordida]CAF1471822.1 unnamed protein product [Rotaria sordida]CAF3633876.1 unnamed protein product [Rotaria sordida]CAF3942099.1 unnamed protein product [Rotaria sordida]